MKYRKMFDAVTLHFITNVVKINTLYRREWMTGGDGGGWGAGGGGAVGRLETHRIIENHRLVYCEFPSQHST